MVIENKKKKKRDYDKKKR